MPADLAAKILAVFFATAPPLLIMTFFQKHDRFPEPPRVVWTTFALGALSVVPIVVIELALRRLGHGIHGPWAASSFQAFVEVALPEEFARFCVIWGYCMRRSEFDEPMDGLVYGVAAAAGFATVE